MERIHVGIVGGGLHSVIIAAYLNKVFGHIFNIRILEPLPLAGSWKNATTALGMQSLRSPWTHGITEIGPELFNYAMTHGIEAASTPRPSLPIFNAYLDSVITKLKLEELHLQSRVAGIKKIENGFEVTSAGNFKYMMENVILATGRGLPNIPKDISGIGLAEHASRISVHDGDWQGKTIAVIGGGLTATTLIHSLLRSGANVFQIIRGQKQQVVAFDFDKGWFGGILYERLREIDDPAAQLAFLNQETVHGSIPPDHYFTSLEWMRAGRLTVREKTTVAALKQRGNTIEVQLVNQDSVEAHQVILATGYTASATELSCLGPILNDLKLHEGLIVLEKDLSASNVPGLYVTGGLARLRLGHAAPNIYGAHLAAELLIPSLKTRLTSPGR